MSAAKDTLTYRVLSLIQGCDRHDHHPLGIKIAMSEWHELAREMLSQTQNACFKLHTANPLEACDTFGCEPFRRAMLSKPGDEGNKIWGVPVTLVPDVPTIEIIHEPSALAQVVGR